MGRTIIPSNATATDGISGHHDRPMTFERLDVERSDGTRFMFGYFDLKWTVLQPSEGRLHLHFATHLVRVTGQNLDVLYRRIQSRELGRLAVDDQRVNLKEGRDEPYVEEIVVFQKPGPTDGLEEYVSTEPGV